MNEQTDHDDRLRDLLRAGDPARDLPPSDPTWIRWQAGRISGGEDDVTPSAAPRRNRRRVGVLAGGLTAAAAAVVAAVVVGTGTAAVTALTAPPAVDPVSQVCATLTPEGLRQNASAFEARVTGVAGGTVTMEVTRRFKGDVEDEVTVPQPATGAATDFSTALFEDGRTYLVSTVDGTQVTSCGQTGLESPELRALYDQAFGA